MNSKTYLKWASIIVPSLLVMLIGGIYSYYRTVTKLNTTEVIQSGSMSMRLDEYTAFFSLLCLVALIFWLIPGLILLLRKIYTGFFRKKKSN
ncbi:hypothetical protein ABD87_00325 [Lysinibacillus sphaericus]|nr:hypothetical protein [Lysinibacillus sphaericus]